MKFRLLTLLLGCLSFPAQANDIDLDCESLARNSASQMVSEGLLANSAAAQKRAEEITLNLCMGAETTAQEQYEEGKQNALTDWIWEDRPKTEGHKRLKNIKR